MSKEPNNGRRSNEETSVREAKPLADRWMHRIRDHPVVAIVILTSVVIIGIAQTSDALIKVRSFFRPPPSVAGPWKYELHSKVSDANYRGAVDIIVSGNLISGEMDNPDPELAGQRSPIQGTIAGDLLTLMRTTNRHGVFQEYRLRRSGNALVGTFSNLGQLPGTRYADSGEVRLVR